ncbi:MAG: hypothetical protein M3443_11165, partial [Actinomycetota bacterium]|nr:hypothetical protein [Actinomycetota bacterium]
GVGTHIGWWGVVRGWSRITRRSAPDYACPRTRNDMRVEVRRRRTGEIPVPDATAGVIRQMWKWELEVRGR